MSNNRFEWTITGNDFTQSGSKRTAADAWTIAGKRAAGRLKGIGDMAAIAVNGDTASVTRATLDKVVAAKVKVSS